MQDDFGQFVNGDNTKLGEMGHILSGGQKARLSLARALYHSRDAEIVLIDSTLSSLDAKVARLVMDRAILGLCANKLVMMVTYEVDQALEMDHVVYMQGRDNRGDLCPPKVMTTQEFIESQMEQVKAQIDKEKSLVLLNASDPNET